MCRRPKAEGNLWQKLGISPGPSALHSYTEDVTSIFDSHQVNHLLYADDKQAYVSVRVYNVSLARQTLEHCISDITSWCASRRLQLNAAKPELIWFGSRKMLAKLTDSDLTLDTGTTVICPSKSVRDLGVHLDSELTMKTHILKVVSCCYHQLRRIRQVSTARRARCRSTARFIFHFIAYRLLQLAVVSSAKVNHSAPAACDECSGSSYHELVARPREASSEAASLAAG